MYIIIRSTYHKPRLEDRADQLCEQLALTLSTPILSRVRRCAPGRPLIIVLVHHLDTNCTRFSPVNFSLAGNTKARFLREISANVKNSSLEIKIILLGQLFVTRPALCI